MGHVFLFLCMSCYLMVGFQYLKKISHLSRSGFSLQSGFIQGGHSPLSPGRDSGDLSNLFLGMHPLWTCMLSPNLRGLPISTEEVPGCLCVTVASLVPWCRSATSCLSVVLQALAPVDHFCSLRPSSNLAPAACQHLESDKIETGR